MQMNRFTPTSEHHTHLDAIAWYLWTKIEINKEGILRKIWQQLLVSLIRNWPSSCTNLPEPWGHSQKPFPMPSFPHLQKWDAWLTQEAALHWVSPTVHLAHFSLHWQAAALEDFRPGVPRPSACKVDAPPLGHNPYPRRAFWLWKGGCWHSHDKLILYGWMKMHLVVTTLYCFPVLFQCYIKCLGWAWLSIFLPLMEIQATDCKM